MSRQIEVSGISKEYRWTPKAKRAVAVVAMLGAGLGGAVAANSAKEEGSASPVTWVTQPLEDLSHNVTSMGSPSETERIIDSPANIPKGHSVELPAVDGQGAIALAQKYGAEGHIEDLAHEIEHEYVDGQLPTGYLPVYDKFVDPKSLPSDPPH